MELKDRVKSIVKSKYKLKQPSEPVGEDEDIDKLKEILMANLIHHEGIGLSAIQLGIKKAVCLVNVKEPIFLVNPEIKESEGSIKYVEGCLSFPDEVVNTNRKTDIIVRADNFKGDLHFGPDEPKFDMDDRGLLESVAVQHEIDHINGVLMFDREVKQEPYVKENDVGRNDKVRIVNPSTGETAVAKYKYVKDKIDYDGWKIQATV